MSAPVRALSKRDLVQKYLQFLCIHIQTGKEVPFVTLRNSHLDLEFGHLLRAHQTSMIVLVTSQG